MSITKKLIDNVLTWQYSPAAIQGTVYDALEQGLNGVDIVECSTPFSFLIEAAATLTCAGLVGSETIARKLYPTLAQSEDELYRHLSDKEYLNRFATPASVDVSFALPKDLVLEFAVSESPQSTSRRLILPRNTRVLVNGIVLHLNYPILIEVLPQNIIRVMYDTSELSPIETIASNIIPHRNIGLNGAQYIEITVPMTQYDITTVIYPVDTSVDFSHDVQFSDMFYCVRVYFSYDNATWQEIKITHTDEIFDAAIPTAVIKVISGEINVSIPSVYQTSNLIGKLIRIDVYSTIGEINTDLAVMNTGDYSVSWTDINYFNNDRAISALGKVNDIYVYSDNKIVGGTSSMSYDELKRKTVYRIVDGLATVRAIAIHIGLNQLGYTVQLMRENVTNRVYVASKNIPSPLTKSTSASIISANINVLIKGSDLLNNSNATFNNGNTRVTLTPRLLFKIVNGVVSVLPESASLTFGAMSNGQKCAALNTAGYYYTPFYYVIDRSDDLLSVRPYRLTAPAIISRSYREYNPNLGVTINTTSAEFKLVNNSFELVLTSELPTGVNVVKCQLKNNSGLNELDLYMNAIVEISGKVVTSTFRFETNFDIDKQNRIILNNFSSSNTNNVSALFNLVSSFEIFYLINDSAIVNHPSDFDNRFINSFYTDTNVGVTLEDITLRFGDFLDNLYCPVQDIIGTVEVMKYADNIVATYTSDVFDRDINGNKTYEVGADGLPVYNILHHQNDVIYDDNNEPILLHQKGDNVLNVFGKTIPVPNTYPEKISLLGITLVSAKYRYATTEDNVRLYEEVPNVFFSYLDSEINPAAQELNELTQLFYKPRNNIGKVEVSYGGRVTGLISGLLDLKFVYYLTDVGIKTVTIQDEIRAVTKAIVAKHFAKTTISVTDITAELKDTVSSEVVAIEMDKFLNGTASVLTLVDAGNSFGVNDVAYVMGDGKIGITDSIEVEFRTAQ